MSSGKYKHRVSIQSVSEVSDAYGGIVETWLTDFQRRASIIESGGSESFESNRERGDRRVVIMMRDDNQTRRITPKNRIVFNSRIFDIITAIKIGDKRKEIELTCVEVDV